jgi:hypothetical protein
MFVKYCCTPPVDSLKVCDNVNPSRNEVLHTDFVLLENDSLVGAYFHPDKYAGNIYFGNVGLYTFFKRKFWMSISYKQIYTYDLFHKTDDSFYNLAHPFIIMRIDDGRIIPLDIKLVPCYRDDGTLVFVEIFRIERFIRWCIWHSNKDNSL